MPTWVLQKMKVQILSYPKTFHRLHTKSTELGRQQEMETVFTMLYHWHWLVMNNYCMLHCCDYSFCLSSPSMLTFTQIIQNSVISPPVVAIPTQFFSLCLTGSSNKIFHDSDQNRALAIWSETCTASKPKNQRIGAILGERTVWRKTAEAALETKRFSVRNLWQDPKVFKFYTGFTEEQFFYLLEFLGDGMNNLTYWGSSSPSNSNNEDLGGSKPGPSRKLTAKDQLLLELTTLRVGRL